MGCALAGVVFVVGDLVYLSPSRERLRQVEAREVALQQQIAHKTGLAASLEARTQQLQRMQVKVNELTQALPGESEMPGLLEDIARLALANGLLVESVTPLDEESQPFFHEQLVQVGVMGTYHDLAMFLTGLGSLSRIATVHDMALRRDGKLLRLDLLVKTYWHAQGGGQRAPRQLFAYGLSGLRDPFQLLAAQVDPVKGRPARARISPGRVACWKASRLTSFEMVGTLSRGVQVFALLRAASKVHRLAVGDYLGPDHGRITAIHERAIELVELFPDGQGAWLERPRTLLLNINS